MVPFRQMSFKCVMLNISCALCKGATLHSWYFLSIQGTASDLRLCRQIQQLFSCKVYSNQSREPSNKTNNSCAKGMIRVAIFFGAE